MVVRASMIDVEIVRSAKHGDQESFAQVYDMIAPELYKVALYTLGNAQDAEDAVSETFIEAYKGIHNLRDEARFKRWMLTILSVRCKRRIGGYIKERKNVDIDELIDLPSSDSDTPNPEHLSVRDAMASLTDQERQIVVLATVQGYTTREVAEMLGLPHGTVSSKLHRTLKKLKKKIE
jgi:RNA polymerase sigma factor (sigma-70 family)